MKSPAPVATISLDARNLTLPSVAVISVVAAFVWGTYLIVQERSRIDKRITATIEAIERLSFAVERLAALQASATTDRYTRTDHDLWCAKFENANRRIGIKCPDIPTKPGSPGRVILETGILIRKEIMKNLKEKAQE